MVTTMLFEIGRVCVKIAGRDAGKKCVVIDDLGDGHVLIDGQTRRKKCNVKHLDPLTQTVSVKKNASPDEVKTELEKIGIEVKRTTPKAKGVKPAQASRVKKTQEAVEEKGAKKKTPAKTEKKAKK